MKVITRNFNAPIETDTRMEEAVEDAIEQRNADERMVEAFVLAVWSRAFRNLAGSRTV